MSRYSQLMAATRNDLCPLCGRGQVGTLDHYLPKTKYPELSVLGLNLVPVCETCNRLKGRRMGTSPDKQTLHAYWDTLPDAEVMVARIKITTAVIVTFKVVRHNALNPILYQRLKYHFGVLRLGKHLQREANLELSDRRDSLREYYGPNHDANALRVYLEREARSVRASRGVNNWKTALLLSLSRSDEFCEGGVLLL